MKTVKTHIFHLLKKVFKLKTHTPQTQQSGIAGIKAGMRPRKFVTLGWDGHPTIVLDNGGVLPRRAELIIHKKYYPNWDLNKWPVCPETGIELEIEDNAKI